MSVADELADFSLNVWLLARYGPEILDAAWDGRGWQRAVNALIYYGGYAARQGPGTLTLFGLGSASGVSHEVDGAGDGREGCLIVECKATGSGITKGDAAIFHAKVMDFYQRDIAHASRREWWRFLCGTVSTAHPARAAALSMGMLISDPARLPLPVLVRAAAQPTADLCWSPAFLQEIVRLGERGMRSLQSRWMYRRTLREVAFDPWLWSAEDIDDLLWLEDELSGALLAFYERRRPGALEARTARLLNFARKVA